ELAIPKSESVSASAMITSGTVSKANFDAVAHMILPAIVLGTIPLAVIVRMTRSSMLEVLGEDYIRTARAKGLTRMRVIIVHA
ncbi:ABC transporter permease subunit, partial [Escherichia coli]|uniref:ABC transporter permease subunit n=1 Tax=Escherichia coli TaxID=562 RepID=UPI002540557B